MIQFVITELHIHDFLFFTGAIIRKKLCRVSLHDRKNSEFISCIAGIAIKHLNMRYCQNLLQENQVQVLVNLLKTAKLYNSLMVWSVLVLQALFID